MSLCEIGWTYACPLCGAKGQLQHFIDPETGGEAGGPDECEIEDLPDFTPTMCFDCGGIFDYYSLIENLA